MFIKNNSFSDQETLLEAIFDFGLGEQSDVLKSVVTAVNKDIEDNEELQIAVKEMDKEEALELLEDVRLDQIAKRLISEFDSFEIYSACFYGIKNSEKQLLAEVTLH